MESPGCPICSAQAHHELRYIRWFLSEYAYDPDTRRCIFDSLGYCPQHTWQIGLLEMQMFDSQIRNNSIYRDLSRVIQGRLTHYAHRVLTQKQSRLRRWLRRTQPGILRLPRPKELQPLAECQICEISAQTERTHLECLLRRFSDTDDDFRKRYAASDGLCLSHLRLGLTLASRSTETAVEFLLEDMLRRLGALEHNLDTFNLKDLQHQKDAKTEDEKNAWLRALTFFGGNSRDNEQHR